MAISFNGVPNGIRVPFLYAEFDNSNAVSGPQTQPYKVMVFGQKLAAGTATALQKYLVTSEAQAKQLFGAGSQLARALKAYFDNNKINEIYVIPQDDAGAGVSATGSFTFAGTATENGTVYLYIDNDRISVPVEIGDTADEIATKAVAQIALNTDSAITAAVDGGVAERVTLAAKNKGEASNLIDLRINYNRDENLPAGITVAVVAMNGGVTNPTVQDALDVLDEDQYLLFLSPYTDSSNLAAIETELNERFGPLLQNDGYHLTSDRGTLSELNSLGNSRNSQFTVIKRSAGPENPFSQMAAVVGQVALSGQIDPARPFQTLGLAGISGESDSEKLKLGERNILLNNGISTDKVDAGGVVRIERLITTYKENPAGAADTSYLDLNTMLTLSYLRYDFRNFWLRKYPRHKLAGDGGNYAAGQAIMTPKLARAEAILKFEEWERLGLVEDAASFAEQLIVERNASDPNRLDFFLPPNLVNQLRVVGVKIGFLL